jgi:hypothetical protein
VVAGRRRRLAASAGGDGYAARAALLAACVLALVFLVAVGSGRSLATVGGPGHVLRARPILGDIAVAALVPALLVWAAIASVLWEGRRRRRRDDEPEWVVEQPPAAWWEKPLLVTAAFLPIAGLVTAIVVLARRLGPTTPPGQTVVGTPTSPAPPARPGAGLEEPTAGPVVHWWLFAAAALLLLLVALAIVVVRRRLAPVARERTASSRGEVQAVIEESLEELEHEPDARRAVIRAYTGMERALARLGLGRRPFEAPLEYLERALVALRVSRTAGERLTALFQRARFSEHPVDPGMKHEAIAALAAVRDELAGQGR